MGLFWRAGTVLLAVVTLSCGTGTAQVCRSHATQYLSSGPGITTNYPNIQTPVRVDCELDKVLLERTCTARYLDQFAQPAVHEQTVRYASLADFVDEAAPPGQVLAISVTVRHDGFDSGTIVAPYLHAATLGETDFVYDRQKRLVSHGFSAWDQGGRPLSIPPTGACQGDTGTQVTYNDAARTVTVDFSALASNQPPDGSSPCIKGTVQWTFDAQGNPIEFEGTSYSIVKTEQVCVTARD